VRPRQITDADLVYWYADEPQRCTFTGPGEVEAGIEPCPGLITIGDPDGKVCRVALELDEIELTHLARGGTIWLSTWGHLPVFKVEVQEP
jgi:hypothetical protein